MNVLLLFGLACRLPASSPGHAPDDGDDDSGDPPDDSGVDLDGDGYETPFDCDDDDATVHPDAPEVCGNGQDDNCLEGPDGCGWSGSQPLQGIALSSEEKNGFAGYALAVCDANGDGQLDVVMSDPFWKEQRGKVFIFYGPVLGPRAVDDADYTLEGTEAYGYTGLALDCRSDFDGDGAADILASSGGDEGTGVMSATFVVPGGRTGGGEIYDEATATWAGAHGDVAYLPIAFDGDGDDRDETAISARSFYGEPWDFGATYLIDDVSPGVYDLESSAFAQVSGTSEDDELYGARGNVGDLDGDGGDDLAIFGAGVHGGGSLYVFETPLFGSLTSADADTRIVDVESGAGTGMSHADLDGDGRDDLLVGSASDGGGGVPGAYVFYGPVDDDTTTKAAPVQIYGCTGASFASLGTNSLLVGTPGGTVALHLFEGPLEGVYDAGADAVATWMAGAHTWAGQDIAIGDVTGDGVADFVIGGAADAEGAGVLIMPSFDL